MKTWTLGLPVLATLAACDARPSREVRLVPVDEDWVDEPVRVYAYPHDEHGPWVQVAYHPDLDERDDILLEQRVYWQDVDRTRAPRAVTSGHLTGWEFGHTTRSYGIDPQHPEFDSPSGCAVAVCMYAAYLVDADGREWLVCAGRVESEPICEGDPPAEPPREVPWDA